MRAVVTRALVSAVVGAVLAIALVLLSQPDPQPPEIRISTRVGATVR